MQTTLIAEQCSRIWGIIILIWARLTSSLGSPRSGERKPAANTAGDLLPATQTESGKKEESAKRFGVTNRGIRANILGDTGGGADLAVKLVLIDTVGSGGFSDVTGSAGKHELVGVSVLFRVEQVGTSNTLAIMSKRGLGRQIEELTIRGRSGNGSGQTAWCRHRQRAKGLQTWCRKSTGASLEV